MKTISLVKERRFEMKFDLKKLGVPLALMTAGIIGAICDFVMVCREPDLDKIVEDKINEKLNNEDGDE